MIAIETEMPKNCIECEEKDIRLVNHCQLIFDGKADIERHPSCPLKEIVTCKYCKHRNGLYTCEKLLVVMEDDCFCCFGERRE